MNRRDVLRLGLLTMGSAVAARAHTAGSAVAAGAQPAAHAIPIVDAHIHLFDPTRPGGVPWPEKTDTALYKPALPERYGALSAPFGVVAAIAIEASPLMSDNDWLLGVAKRNPLIVGVVGDLVPGSASYAHDLDRLHADPLFLGFRYGNLWNRDLATDLDKPGFVEGLKALAQAGLVFESANPDPALIGALVAVSERVHDLRIVVDHLPHATIPAEPAARREYEANLKRLAQNPRVFVKLSEIPVVQDGRVVTDAGFYRAGLDALWDLFGADRVIFGSDWPNSDHVAPYAETMAIVRGYIAQKSEAAKEKYYWRNSIAAYRWQRRRPDQRQL